MKIEYYRNKLIFLNYNYLAFKKKFSFITTKLLQILIMTDLNYKSLILSNITLYDYLIYFNLI